MTSSYPPLISVRDVGCTCTYSITQGSHRPTSFTRRYSRTGRATALLLHAACKYNFPKVDVTADVLFSFRVTYLFGNHRSHRPCQDWIWRYRVLGECPSARAGHGRRSSQECEGRYGFRLRYQRPRHHVRCDFVVPGAVSYTHLTLPTIYSV